MAGTAALICAISFALLMLAAVVVVLKLAGTMTLTNHILNDIRKEALPLMGKFQTTMDHINDEMGYIDRILRSLENLAARANSVTRVAQQLVTSPLVKILSVGVRVQRALGLDSSRKGKVEAETGGEQE